MICPACNEGMLVVEYRQIEVDFCPKCRGLWFDKTELQLLMSACGISGEKQFFVSLENLLTKVFHETGLPVRKCPICNRKMTLVNAGKDDKIIIDVCTRKHGIWFDGGELIQLIHQSIASSDIPEEIRNVLSYLQETFKYVN